MSNWPRHPVIYEINTWVWLQELSQKYERFIDLASIPDQEWKIIADLKPDAVWFMGVWERSPEGKRIGCQDEALLDEFRCTLPDFTLDDVAGSPYCVHRYVVDEHLGGPAGLAAARKELARRGIRLILDFVPNHVARDHPWTIEHSEYFIQGTEEDLVRSPAEFFATGGQVIAMGRDPYFPPWPDVAQLNAFAAGLRSAAVNTLSEIATQCDGVRCDMAMLFINRIFQRTWGNRAGDYPEVEFWPGVIQSVHARFPSFLFIAEAYWDLEWELQQQGFDYCYDKRLYDRLAREDAENVRLHLLGDIHYQEKLLRFIENHDEPRAASTFSPQKEYIAALTIATLPGARLFHEGQLEGRKIKLSVFLGRRPTESPDLALQAFYRKLLRLVATSVFKTGEWKMCERKGWPDNPSFMNLISWCWRKGKVKYLIVVNLSEYPSQAQIELPWKDLDGRTWRLTEALSNDFYDRDGHNLENSGLYVDLPGWGYHFLKFSALS